MAATRRKQYRTTKAVQRYWEDMIREIETCPKYLEEGQEGYITGENTPNPEYISSPTTRLKMRAQAMSKLQALLPIHEVEQRAEELEAKIMELLEIIQQKAPSLLQGMPYNRKSGLY